MRDIKSIITDLNCVKKFLEELPVTQGKGVIYAKQRMILLQIKEVNFPEYNVFSSNKAIHNAWSRVRFNTIQRINALDDELCNTVLHALKSTHLHSGAGFFGAMVNLVSSNFDNSKAIIEKIEKKISRKDGMYTEDYKASILETIREAIEGNPPENLRRKLQIVEEELMQNDLQNGKTVKKALSS